MRIISRGIVNQGVAGGPRAVSSFPSVTVLPDGRLLATYRVGSTKDSDDETVEFRFSSDSGESWSEPAQPFPPPAPGKTGSVRVIYVTTLEGAHLIAAALWIDRESYPGQPLFNPETEGCLPMAVLLSDSFDLGHTWTDWRTVPIPDEIGPPSLTNPILRFHSGRMALSIESNKPYLDRSRWLQKVVHIGSDDGGRTWLPPSEVCSDPAGRVFHWDQRAAVTPDGSLVAFSWTYDREANCYLDIRRHRSSDEGRSWTAPEEIGITDQPSHPAILPDGRIVLAWVDRFGTCSIRARMAAHADAAFKPETEVVLLDRGRPAASTTTTSEMLADMSIWTFGLPYAEALPDGSVLVLYYAGDSRSMGIHWVRLDTGVNSAPR